MIAIEAFDGVAALTGIALVTARAGVVVKVSAARPLQQIAADRCHIADLRRGTREDRARQHRIAPAHGGVLCERSVAHRCADQQAATLAHGDVRRQAGDIPQRRRTLYRLAHQVDQIGAAAEKFGLRGGAKAQRFGDVAGA